jgi:hypothetical protein
MKRTALMIGALLLAAPVASQQSHAVEGPWCAYESVGHDSYSSRCDLPSYEACRDWIRASPGTWCTQNPRFVPVDRLQRGRVQRPRMQ